MYVNPSRTEVKWDAQDGCRIYAPLPPSSPSKDNTKDLAARQKEIEKIVNASASAGDLSVKLGIAPDCDPLSPDEFLCQWDDYHIEMRSYINVFCVMFVNQSRKKVIWDAQDDCRIYAPLPLNSSAKYTAENLAARQKEIEKIVNASASAGDLSVKLGIAPDCGSLIADQNLEQILCQWHDYHGEGSTISVFCSMFLNNSRTKAIWDAQDGCRIYAPLPPEPKPKLERQ
jgi:bacterioferritin-associated ferredoxin